MENILVYYVDEKAPTFTMKNLSGGIIAVIVVVVLAVVAGLLVLVGTSEGHYYPEGSGGSVSPNFVFVSVVLRQEATEQEVQQSPGEPGCSERRLSDRKPRNLTFVFFFSKERTRTCEAPSAGVGGASLYITFELSCFCVEGVVFLFYLRIGSELFFFLF